jgi:hypothetical protein
MSFTPEKCRGKIGRLLPKIKCPYGYPSVKNFLIIKGEMPNTIQEMDYGSDTSSHGYLGRIARFR